MASDPERGLRRRVAIYLSTRLLLEYGEQLLAVEVPEVEREMLRRTRQLVRLLEGRVMKDAPDRDVIDLERQRSLRAIRAALGVPPRSPPPAQRKIAHAR
jgi:hypothetical protein